jgi:hypothetical protein
MSAGLRVMYLDKTMAPTMVAMKNLKIEKSKRWIR